MRMRQGRRGMIRQGRVASGAGAGTAVGVAVAACLLLPMAFAARGSSPGAACLVGGVVLGAWSLSLARAVRLAVCVLAASGSHWRRATRASWRSRLPARSSGEVHVRRPRSSTCRSANPGACDSCSVSTTMSPQPSAARHAAAAGLVRRGRSPMRAPVARRQRWRYRRAPARAAWACAIPGGFDARKARAGAAHRGDRLRAQTPAPRVCCAADGHRSLARTACPTHRRSGAAPDLAFRPRARARRHARLGDDDWATLRATGLTHLIAISGFHVGLVAGFFALLAPRAVALCAGPWRGVCPRPVALALAAVAGASLYTARRRLRVADRAHAC